MVEFSRKILILGCGSVCQCTLPILLKHIDVAPKNVTIMDFADNRKRINSALKKGVRYIQKRVTKANYASVLKEQVQEGDILIDLSWEIETRSLIEWCHANGVAFLNTSVEVWNALKQHPKDPAELTLYHRQMALHEMVRSWKNKKGPTAIIDHGANPGLVSHFTKQALVDIATRLVKKKDRRRASLEKALSTQNFPALAHLSGVKTIHISERDTQITRDPKKVNEFVNTWSVAGLLEEGMAPAEIGWGTHERTLPEGARTHKTGPRNQIFLSQKGAKTWVQSWVPSGPITGMVIRHGEAYSISKYLTVWKGDKPIYRPTVHYAYCPCDSTINSLHELEMRHFVPQTDHRILNDEVISGKDELGCLLMGHDFRSWWIGSILDVEESRRLVPHQNATTVQVAIAIVAAAIYIVRHPNEGFCTPDDLDYKEILAIAKPYLGEFLSIPVNWSPLDHAQALSDFGAKVPPEKDMWQFSTFQIGWPCG